MKNIGAGIAITGIWVGLGIIALSGQPVGVITVPAMFASIAVAVFLRDA